MIGTYASALLISLVAVVLGRGICVACEKEGSSWLSPAVGFAALMVICKVAISLPGRGWTAVGAVVVLCAAAIWLPARRRERWPSAIEAACVTLPLLLVVSIPFIANGRVGVLGISVLNDTHWHLLFAEGLRRQGISAYGYGPGYPLGPHAIAATFAQGLGSDVDKTLTGVLMAVPLLTGLTVLGLLRDLSASRRWLVAVLAGIPYLAAAWYIQSAFKEPILSLMLVGLVLALRDGRRTRFARAAAVAVPIAVLTSGVLYDYSYPGLVWVVGVIVCWLALELVLGGWWRRLSAVRRWLRFAWPGLGVGVVALVVLEAPDLHRIYDFWISNGGTSAGNFGGIQATGPSSLANLALPLRAAEGLDIWLNSDFRFVPSDSLRAGLLAGFALVVLAYAVVVALERREFEWLGAILALGLIYVYTRHSQSPYVAAKALTIPGPLLVVGSGGALMSRLKQRAWRTWTGLGFAAAAAVFFFFSFDSSYLVLRNAFVGPGNHTAELRSLRRFLHGRQTLALFYDDYIHWELLGQQVSSPLITGPVPVAFSPQKPWSYGQPIDFDSVTAETLDQFAYVITTRTDAQSQPPPNFHLIAVSRSYEVWRRIGPTERHDLLPESGSLGALLNCGTAAGRRVAHEHGFAMVRTAPLQFSVAPLAPGGSEHVGLALPKGEWEVSIPFTSDQAITVRGGGLDRWLPPNLDRPGEAWKVGVVRSDGREIVLTITMAHAGLLGSTSQFFTPEPLIAVPAVPDQRIPLSKACGRFVDWYVPR